MSDRRAGLAAPLLGLAAGVGLVGATTATWVEREAVREIADAEVIEVIAAPGAEVAGAAVALGIAAALLAVLVIPARGRVRRGLGALLGLIGLLAAVDVGRGALAAAERDGALTGAPAAAGVAALAVVAAGVLAARRPRPSPALPPRFDLDGNEEAGEWQDAADPRDEG